MKAMIFGCFRVFSILISSEIRFFAFLSFKIGKLKSPAMKQIQLCQCCKLQDTFMFVDVCGVMVNCSAKRSFFACTLHPGIVPGKQWPFRVRWKLYRNQQNWYSRFQNWWSWLGKGTSYRSILGFWDFANSFFCKSHICLKTIAPLPVICWPSVTKVLWLDCSFEMVRSQSLQCW